MIKLEEIAGYLPHKLNMILTVDYREDYYDEDYYDEEKFKEGAIWQLAGYADSDLSIPMGDGEINGFIFRNENTYACFYGGYKFLFRSLSDLTREIEVNGEKFVPCEKFGLVSTNQNQIFLQRKVESQYMTFKEMQILISLNFDIFGLIERGDAIDINTLK